jgi:hypothetical protein
MMNSKQSFEICKEAKRLGLVIRYDTIEYRDQEINFLSDPSGVQCFAQWNSQIVDLGLNNIFYKEDMCRFIDRKLDLITEFTETPELLGARLEYFNNGNFRDIKLSYKGRILKIFLISELGIDETFVISKLVNKSKEILYSSGLLEEF